MRIAILGATSQIARDFVPIGIGVLKGFQQAEQPRLEHLSLGHREIRRGEALGQALQLLHDFELLLCGVV